ncbi:MAG: hypothetical protein OXM57_02245 [bacterium]|nr:hypothetical protein [bacterium]MDE0351503.1 hypothetical protein [bacterium]
MLFIVFVAGVLAAVLMITGPIRTSQRAAPSSTAAPPAAGGQETGQATPEWATPPESVATDAESEGGDPTAATGHDHSHDTDPSAWLTGTTVRYPPETGEEVGRASTLSALAPADAVADSDPAAELRAMEPGQCPPIEELWVADGRPVEDPCTLAEVQRATYLAYTGTDPQRRSAIRNGPLLDEVFAALDDFGRTHDAALYHPERRGRSSVVFEEIVWRGGPEADRGVIAVRYRLHHPDFVPTDLFLDTLVQVDGEWKLSYRRSYCVKVLVIMEHIGSDVRCPRDPTPEVNEDEAPGSTGRY